MIKFKNGRIQKYIFCQVVKNHHRSYDLLLGLDAMKAFQRIHLQETLKMLHAKLDHYQWRVLPFRLKTSSQIFQRILSNITINYIDDILIFSETFEDDLKRIQQFLDAVKKDGFRLKLVKCTFAAESVKYLDQQIQKNRVTPAQGNSISIQKPQRQNKSGVTYLVQLTTFSGTLKIFQKSSNLAFF